MWDCLCGLLLLLCFWIFSTGGQKLQNRLFSVFKLSLFLHQFSQILILTTLKTFKKSIWKNFCSLFSQNRQNSEFVLDNNRSKVLNQSKSVYIDAYGWIFVTFRIRFESAPIKKSRENFHLFLLKRKFWFFWLFLIKSRWNPATTRSPTPRRPQSSDPISGENLRMTQQNW